MLTSSKRSCATRLVCALGICSGLAIPAQPQAIRSNSPPDPPFPVWTATAGQTNANFGGSIASAGDVNGDGFADIIVGAYHYTHTAVEQGAAFAYYGSASGLPVKPSWAAYARQKTVDFGISVASAGDVNRDGFDDVIVGATGYTFVSGQYNVGAALVYLGSPGGLSTNYVWRAKGPHPGSGFGYSVSGAGDINGDGFRDLIIGAPGYAEHDQSVGKVFVFHGSTNGFGAKADWTFTGKQAGARLGHPVASAGDVNRDGFGDVMVAAREHAVRSLPSAGLVLVFYGSAQGLSRQPNWSFRGDQAYARLGFGIARAGDVNDDGYGDIIIGANGVSRGQEKEGTAYVFYGSAKGLAGPDWFVEGNRNGASLGYAVGGAGDVNGDGFDDVIIGAIGYNSTKNVHQGRTFVFHGSPAGLGTKVAWIGVSTRYRTFFGNTVASAGDVNRDGFADVIVGAMMDAKNAEGGQIQVYAGSQVGVLPADEDVGSYPISARRLAPPAPPLWKRGWFAGAVGLAVVGLAAALWHVMTTTRLSRELRRTQQQRALEQERLRIAQDLHDHLGSNLTTITLLSEMARRELGVREKAESHLHHITGTARDLTRALEHIVWAVNPRKDKLDQLVSYFSAYAGEFLKPTELRCRLDFPDELPELVVPSEIRHQLFLVLKEAMTNVVKHAKATEVRISLQAAPARLTLSIQDDGRGFDTTAAPSERNGLTNVRERIERLGGVCEIFSRVNQGTRIRVQVILDGGRRRPAG